MKKILFLLLSTESYTQRQDNVLNSWGKNEDLFFYSESENIDRNVIKVCDENDVEIKQISIFKKIEKEFYNNYEWYFFGDDDTFVNVKLLKNIIDTFDKTKVIGSDIFGCWKDLHYPSGGAGFLIHNNLIHNFFDSRNFHVNYSDVTFGLNMKEKNIDISNNDLFRSQRYDFYNIEQKDVFKYITFHYIHDIHEMEEMHKLCSEKNV
jgi:hypothetical protein